MPKAISIPQSQHYKDNLVLIEAVAANKKLTLFAHSPNMSYHGIILCNNVTFSCFSLKASGVQYGNIAAVFRNLYFQYSYTKQTWNLNWMFKKLKTSFGHDRKNMDIFCIFGLKQFSWYFCIMRVPYYKGFNKILNSWCRSKTNCPKGASKVY